MAQGSVTTTTWGTVDGREVKKFTLRNEAGQEVDVVTYGATVTAVRTPDREGNVADVVLGFDDVKGIPSSSRCVFSSERKRHIFFMIPNTGRCYLLKSRILAKSFISHARTHTRIHCEHFPSFLRERR